MNIKEKIETNTWEENLDEVFDFILDILKIRTKEGGRWIWWKNSRCKYINLKIDMRDGGFLLLDRNGERISFEELKKQNF
jgi:hypothetical protein